MIHIASTTDSITTTLPGFNASLPAALDRDTSRTTLTSHCASIPEVSHNMDQELTEDEKLEMASIQADFESRVTEKMLIDLCEKVEQARS